MNRCKGIVLSTLAFGENDQIITLFSPEGLVKFFVKGKHTPLIACLTEGEFLFVRSNKGLHRFRDGSILNQHLQLRKRFESIEAACMLVQAILKSQWQENAAPNLYHLLCYCLKKIPNIEEPKNIVTIFLIKTLKHEGLLQQHDSCLVCGEKTHYRFRGERFCKKHAPPLSLQLTSQQEEQFIKIVRGRSLNELLSESTTLYPSITTLFNQAFVKN